VFFIKHHCK